jgi:hypothetical protein
MHSEYVVDLMALLHAELNAERQERDSAEKELRRRTGEPPVLRGVSYW